MSLAQTMLDEFERSLKATRMHLDRVFESRLDWRPAPQSMSLGQLALHLAEAPGAAVRLGLGDSAELPRPTEAPSPACKAEILAAFDSSIETVRRNLPGVSDDSMQETVTFTLQGQPVWSPTRAELWRDYLLNHTYHHRGQLGVYLRLLDVPVPMTFGPSADDRMPTAEPSEA